MDSDIALEQHERVNKESEIPASSDINSEEQEGVKQDSGIRVRTSVRTLMKDETKLNALLRAWKRIQELPPDNLSSFWVLAGYHGEPFVDHQAEKPLREGSNYWGGYCQHANVLFPMWHRFYVLQLEQALRTVCPDDDITMPYWDETSEETLQHGMPEIFIKNQVMIDGVLVDNPLKSFTFPCKIGGTEADNYFHKPRGYTTVRYPYSGIRSPPPAALVAAKHNSDMEAHNADDELNGNITGWMNGTVPGAPNINELFVQCLNATSYNAFSNTSSAGLPINAVNVTLESPHNDIHLAVGGFDLGGQKQPADISGANGDMGENETAAFDPIFFFHHCNIDRMFWIWQKKWGCMDTSTLVIDEDKDDPGVTPTGGQGATPYQNNDEILTMHTPLHPFQLPNGELARSEKCVNINTDLKYDYSLGSLDEKEWAAPVHITTKIVSAEEESLWISKQMFIPSHDKNNLVRAIIDVTDAQIVSFVSPIFIAGNRKLESEAVVMISKIDMESYLGSVVVLLYWREPDSSEWKLVGRRSILSRWNRKLCANCQKRPRFKTVKVNVTRCMAEHTNWNIRDFQVKISYFNPEAGQHEVVEESAGELKLYRVWTPVVRV